MKKKQGLNGLVAQDIYFQSFPAKNHKIPAGNHNHGNIQSQISDKVRLPLKQMRCQNNPELILHLLPKNGCLQP